MLSSCEDTIPRESSLRIDRNSTNCVAILSVTIFVKDSQVQESLKKSKPTMSVGRMHFAKLGSRVNLDIIRDIVSNLSDFFECLRPFVIPTVPHLGQFPPGLQLVVIL